MAIPFPAGRRRQSAAAIASIVLFGAVVLPASPGFYHGAETVADLVDFVVARICDQLGVANALMRRWGEAT